MQGLPKSLFAKRPMVPNTIDADWKFVRGVYEPNLAGTSRKLSAAPASSQPTRSRLMAQLADM